MTNNIRISIPSPCHENWGAMSPVEKGRFCNSCQKQVVDFTRMGDREIAGVLESNKNVCGRILPSQLDRELVIPHHRKRHAVAIAAVAVLAASPAISQAQTPVQTEQHPIDERMVMGKMIAVPVKRMVTGTVVAENNEPMPYANVTVKGYDFEAVTDGEGKFSISAGVGNVLVITSVGYEPLEVTVREQDFTNPLQLSPSPGLLGEMVVVKNHGFFGRIFYRIGNLFR